MLKGLYTAYTGMLNEQHRMDVLTNNLANATTNGFKKEGTTSEAFDTVLAYKIKDLSEPGNLPRPMATNRAIDEAELNNPLNENYLERRVRKTGLNLGVKIGENYVDYSEGPIKETGNPLDLALSDRGFFAVEYTNKRGETSTKYTRDGNFTMNMQGFCRRRMVTMCWMRMDRGSRWIRRFRSVSAVTERSYRMAMRWQQLVSPILRTIIIWSVSERIISSR